MKLLSYIVAGACSLSFMGGAFAQEATPLPLVPAKVPGKENPIYIVTGNDKVLRYKTTAVEQGDAAISLSEAHYFFLEPQEFRTALDQYKNRNYEAAIKGFKTVQDLHRNVREIPYNYSALAEFYMYDSQRRLMNVAAFDNIDTAHLKKLLPWNEIRTQAAIYDLWKLAAKKDWNSLQLESAKVARPGLDKLTRSQMVQIFYLSGLAYASQNKTKDALDAFAKSMLIDGTNSPEITREAILRSMEIYAKDAETVQFMKERTPDSKATRPAYLNEGAALMNLWKNVLFISPEIPKEYDKFLLFYKEPPKPKKEPQKEEAKPAPPAPAPAAAPAEKK